MHNQYLEGTLQQTKSRKQKYSGLNNWEEVLLHLSTNMSETNHTSQWRKTFPPYGIFHLISNNNKNTTLITFEGVNTSAEWIKKEKKTKKTLVKDVSRAAGSVSATRAERQNGGQRITATNQWSTFSPQLSLHAGTCSLHFQSKWP